MQTAILGAHEKGTLLSDLINRLRPRRARLAAAEGTVKADSLVLGPVTLKDATSGAALCSQPARRSPASTPNCSAARAWNRHADRRQTSPPMS